MIDQLVPIEYGVDGANGRQRQILVQAADLLADLRGAPGRMFSLELSNQFLELQRQPVRLSIRSTTAIGQSFE